MDEFIELLERDYERVLLELANYARARIRGHLWRGDAFVGCGNKQELVLPGGQTAEDLVLEVFQDVLSGTRTWDKTRFPELMPVLKGMIKSKISNCFTSKENQTTIIVSSTDEDGIKNFDFEEGLGANHHNLDHSVGLLPPHAREDSSQSTRTSVRDTYLDELFKEVAGDQELEDALAAIKLGAESAREIADLSGIPIARVYELNRKLTGIAERITKRVALRHLVEKATQKGGS